jgi:hypothetical protein
MVLVQTLYIQDILGDKEAAEKDAETKEKDGKNVVSQENLISVNIDKNEEIFDTEIREIKQ